MRFEKGNFLGYNRKACVTAVCYRADYVSGTVTFYYHVLGYLVSAAAGLSELRLHLEPTRDIYFVLQQYVGKFRYGTS